MSRSSWLIAPLLALGLVSPALASDVPSVMQVQGTFTTAGGSAANGTYDLTFKLWTAETGGTALWTQGVTGVVVADGVFSSQLTVSPANLFEANQTLWLETQVGAEAPLPRQRLLTSAYAFEARHAVTAETSKGVSCTGCISGLAIGPGVVSAAHLADGAVTAAKAGFNYAGSASKGGPAGDLACSGCVADTEVSFNYAGSASKGGGASDVACTTCVSTGEVDFAWAAGASKGGAATDVACSGCVAGTEIASNAITSGHIADGSIGSRDVAFNYAGSASKGGAATDVACSGCIAGGEIEANPTISGNLTLSGSIQSCTANSTGCYIRVSDDGGFYDQNDAWITTRVTAGLKVRTQDNTDWRPVYAGDGVFAGVVAAGGAGLQLDKSWGGYPSIRTEGNTEVRVHSASGTALLRVQGGIMAGGSSAITGNLAVSGVATMLRHEVTAGQIAIRQVSPEGNTRIFADYSTAHSWGIYHENGPNRIHFTRQDGAGFQQWTEAGPDATTTTTSVASVDLADGSARFYGNVGIGTASPAARLDVNGPARMAWHEVTDGQIAVRQVSTEGNTRIFADFGPYHSWGLYHENGLNTMHFTRRDGAGFQQWSEAGPEGTTTTTSVMQIRLDDGRVAVYGSLGVGTAAPGYKLHVVGNTRIENELYTGGTAFFPHAQVQSFDGVFSSSYGGYTHHMIGTYYGWDKNAVYIGGYGRGNSSLSTERVWIGGSGANIDLHITGTFYGKSTAWCDCYNHNHWGTFDGPNWGTCDGAGYFMVGYYQSCTGGTYCIEEFKCCRPCSFRAQ